MDLTVPLSVVTQPLCRVKVKISEPAIQVRVIEQRLNSYLPYCPPRFNVNRAWQGSGARSVARVS